MPTVQNQMKNQFSDFSDFYSLSYCWLYLQFAVTHLAFQLCHRTKSSKSGQIHRKYAQWAETNGRSIFRYLIFEIWSILYWHFFSTWVFFRATFSFRDMVDFAYGWPYTILTKSPNKNLKAKNHCQINAHLSCEFGHFWTTLFFWSVAHLVWAISQIKKIGKFW